MVDLQQRKCASEEGRPTVYLNAILQPINTARVFTRIGNVLQGEKQNATFVFGRGAQSGH